jgi:hypothetical protein
VGFGTRGPWWDSILPERSRGRGRGFAQYVEFFGRGILIDEGEVDLYECARFTGATLLFVAFGRLLPSRGNPIGLEREKEREKARERPGLLSMGFCKDGRA